MQLSRIYSSVLFLCFLLLSFKSLWTQVHYPTLSAGQYPLFGEQELQQSQVTHPPGWEKNQNQTLLKITDPCWLGFAPGALALSLSAGEALAQAFCVLGWVRGVRSLDLWLLGLRHFLACSSEIAFNLHKLWGIFLLFLQFLFLEFKLNRIQKQENYLQMIYKGRGFPKTLFSLPKGPNDFDSQQKKSSPCLHFKYIYIFIYVAGSRSWGKNSAEKQQPTGLLLKACGGDENLKIKAKEENKSWGQHTRALQLWVRLNVTHVLEHQRWAANSMAVPSFACASLISSRSSTESFSLSRTSFSPPADICLSFSFHRI